MAPTPATCNPVAVADWAVANLARFGAAGLRGQPHCWCYCHCYHQGRPCRGLGVCSLAIVPPWEQPRSAAAGHRPMGCCEPQRDAVSATPSARRRQRDTNPGSSGSSSC